MTPQQRAAALRAEGRTYAEIAAAVGVSPHTAYRWLNLDYAERDRATSRGWKDRNPQRVRTYNRSYYADASTWAECSDCGGPMSQSPGSNRYDGTQRCESCRSAEVECRREEIVAMWDEGLSMREIADAHGWTVGRLSVAMVRMREAGYDLPYRRRPSNPRFAAA